MELETSYLLAKGCLLSLHGSHSCALACTCEHCRPERRSLPPKVTRANLGLE